RRGSRRPAGPSRRCSTLRTASGATKHGAARPPRRRRGLPRSTGGVRPRPSEAVAHGAVDVAFRAHEAVTAREAGGVVVLAQQVGRVELERPVAPGELGVGVDQRVGGRTNAVGKGEPERTMRALVTHAAAEGQDRLGADREPPERPERGVLLWYAVDLHLGAVDLGLVVAEIGDQLPLAREQGAGLELEALRSQRAGLDLVERIGRRVVGDRTIGLLDVVDRRGDHARIVRLELDSELVLPALLRHEGFAVAGRAGDRLEALGIAVEGRHALDDVADDPGAEGQGVGLHLGAAERARPHFVVTGAEYHRDPVPQSHLVLQVEPELALLDVFIGSGPGRQAPSVVGQRTVIDVVDVDVLVAVAAGLADVVPGVVHAGEHQVLDRRTG